MKATTYILIALCLLGINQSCRKPSEIGFISDRIATKEDTIYVSSGVVHESQIPEIDGSSRPTTFKILRARYGESGEHVSEQLLKPMKVSTWKEAFDRTVQTTKAEVLSIINDTLLAPVIINPNNGQLLFQTSTQYLTESTLYYLDVEVSNPKGTRVVNNYAIIKLTPTIPFEVTTNVNRTRVFYIAEDGTKIQFFNANDNDYLSLDARIKNNTDPYFKVEKIADEPETGIKMYFGYADTYGNYVDPQNVKGWPNADPNATINGTYQNWYWNATDTAYDSKYVILDFPMTPWPYYSKFWPYPSFNHTLSYMETDIPIPLSSGVQIDTAALLHAPNNIAAAQSIDDFRRLYQAGKGSISLYSTTAFRFNQGGTWRTTCIFPGVKLK